MKLVVVLLVLLLAFGCTNQSKTDASQGQSTSQVTVGATEQEKTTEDVTEQPVEQPVPVDTSVESTEGQDTDTKVDDAPVEKTPVEIVVTAKQWEFDPEVIEVNEGDHVKLIVTSIDVQHGFSIPEYGVDENLVPGKTVTVEFDATKKGEFTFFCSVFCGEDHSNMKGTLIVR